MMSDARPTTGHLAGSRAHQLTSFGQLLQGDIIEELAKLPDASAQLIIADPPYFQVLTETRWDNCWSDQEVYLSWVIEWVQACKRVLRPDGLFYIFGQPGKREHVFLHLCSRLCLEMQFHDLIIWDRAVGYNERSDSFTPQYEMILALRHPLCPAPYFNKDAARIPYDEETIKLYLRDKRYKDLAAREDHLRKGKFATNILRVPSLKGSSREKVGHPSQKPLRLIELLVASSSRVGDTVIDLFAGSGTTSLCCEGSERKWIAIECDPDYAELIRRRLTATNER